MTWAAQYLATEVDDLNASGVLDAHTALRRLNDLHGSAIHEDFLTASPGTVHAFDCSTKEIVEHTCSVLPGLSGGAGEPFAIHAVSNKN